MTNGEIDALVEEKLFDRQRYPKDSEMLTCSNDGSSCINPQEPRPFSTDIAAAWEVVEKLRSIPKTGLVINAYPIGMAYNYVAHVPATQFQAIADTAPLAICLVALKIMGIETE